MLELIYMFGISIYLFAQNFALSPLSSEINKLSCEAITNFLQNRKLGSGRLEFGGGMRTLPGNIFLIDMENVTGTTGMPVQNALGRVNCQAKCMPLLLLIGLVCLQKTRLRTHYENCILTTLLLDHSIPQKYHTHAR